MSRQRNENKKTNQRRRTRKPAGDGTPKSKAAGRKPQGARKSPPEGPRASARRGASRGGRPARRDRGASRQTWVGVVSAHPDGFGFVDVEGRDKGLFLPPEAMRGLMHGDVVEVRAARRRGRESGEVVRIIEQAPSVLVGQFVIEGGVGLVQPRSRRMPQNILVRKRDANGARDGDWVKIEVKRGDTPLSGRVLEVLGRELTPARLIDLIVAEQGIETEFPPEALAEAEALPAAVRRKDMEGRTDLRHLPFVTIDGADARDFDDAICVLPRGDGFEAWVAIADVAQYVPHGSALDAEARRRGNSFYFPDRVIPMLPEKLSNGLCSLNPNVPRLAMAVRMRFDPNGRRRAVQAFEAVIHSQARLTYDQAAEWLEDRREAAVASPKVREMLDAALRLHRKLERLRKRRGALDLDVPEVRAVLHEGSVANLSQTRRNVAHHLIEELMLAANTAVAEYMERKQCALLYRVHPAPERESIESLNEFLKPFGIFVRLPKAGEKDARVRPGDVQWVLEKSEGKPYSHVLHRLVLRSMQQARYTTENEGHFGLAYPTYCHFTSPIRRYADLTVHRRLKALLRKQNPDAMQPASELEEIGLHVSVQERKQQRAEWDTQAMLAALYHEKDVGKTMPAIISGVTKRRIFVELQPTLAEAALDVDDLGGMFELDETRHRLHARRGGASHGLGDRLMVVIDSVDPVRGLIRARMAEEAAERDISGARTPARAE